MPIRCLNIFNDLKIYEEKFREDFDEYFTVDESNKNSYNLNIK